jgi:hypothetical protein
VNRKRPETGVKNRVDQNREKSQQNRFKIVNYTRALNETTEACDTSTTNLIVDVEKDATNNIVSAASSSAQSSSFSDLSDEPYVYDIYIADATETSVLQSQDFDLNDLRLVLMEEVYCSYYAYM